VVFESESDDSAIRLIDLVTEHKTLEQLAEYKIPTYDASTINQDEIIRQLHDVLASEIQTENSSHLTEIGLKYTISAANKFLDLLEKIMEIIGPHLPRPSLFITPADIYHAENLYLVQ